MTTNFTDKKNLPIYDNKLLLIRAGLDKDINAFFELFWISSLDHQRYNEKFDTL